MMSDYSPFQIQLSIIDTCFFNYLSWANLFNSVFCEAPQQYRKLLVCSMHDLS